MQLIGEHAIVAAALTVALLGYGGHPPILQEPPESDGEAAEVAETPEVDAEAVAPAPAPVARPGGIVATIHDRAAAHGVSGARLEAVARCESTLNLYAVGRAGERGLFQLHPQGLLRTFYAWGYTDPASAWQQSDFTARAFAAGMARHWSCAR